MPAIAELQETKNELVKEIRELADIPSDQWSAEQEAKWTDVNKRYDDADGKLQKALSDEETAKARVQRLHELEQRSLSTKTRTQLSNVAPNPSQRDAEWLEADRELRAAHCFKSWMLHANGRDVPEVMRQSCSQAGFVYTQENMSLNIPTGLRRPGQLWTEQRDMSTSPGVGGETIPLGFQRELEQALLDFGGLRRESRILTTSREGDLEWPLWNDVSNKSTIVGEAQDTGPSVDPTTSNVIFKSYKYSSTIIVSSEFLDDAFMPMDSVIAEALGTRLGRGTAEHYISGDGVAAPQGITVGGHVAHTTATNSAFDFDDVLSLIHGCDPSYRRQGPMFVMNDNTLLEARKLKDNQNRYLWEPSLQVGEASRLFGYPYIIDQDMPDIGSTARFMAFGTINQHYVIRDVSQSRFYRLEELYRRNDQTGFQLLSRHDGRVLDAGTHPIVLMAAPA